jgi:hypothetical protein
MCGPWAPVPKNECPGYEQNQLDPDPSALRGKTGRIASHVRLFVLSNPVAVGSSEQQAAPGMVCGQLKVVHEQTYWLVAYHSLWRQVVGCVEGNMEAEVLQQRLLL